MIKSLLILAFLSTSTFLAQVDLTSLNLKEITLGAGGLAVAFFCVKFLADFAGKKIDRLVESFEEGSRNLKSFMDNADHKYQEGLDHMKEMKESMKDIADKFSKAQCIKN